MSSLEPYTSSRLRGGPLLVVCAIVPAYLVLDLFAISIVDESRSGEIPSLISGVVLSQFGLLALWAVLGPGPWFVRQPAAMFGVLISYGALLSNGRVGAERELFRVALMLPLVFLCLQSPLWLFRLICGWQIVPSGEPRIAIADARRFSLGQLFAATTVVAVAIGLAEVGHETERWYILPVAVGAAVFGLVAVAPCAWSGLGARYVAAGTFSIFAYAVGGIMAFILVLSFIARTPQNAFICLEIFAVTIVGMMHGILVAVRETGFVLQRASKRREAK